MVYIDELSNVLWKHNVYADINMKIGERKYYNAYFGHQVNKIPSEARERLIEMYA